MNPWAVGLALGVGVVWLALMGLTATGEHRRGHGVFLVLAAGVFFPITWIVWYLVDEQPYRAVRRV